MAASPCMIGAARLNPLTDCMRQQQPSWTQCESAFGTMGDQSSSHTNTNTSVLSTEAERFHFKPAYLKTLAAQPPGQLMISRPPSRPTGYRLMQCSQAAVSKSGAMI